MIKYGIFGAIFMLVAAAVIATFQPNSGFDTNVSAGVIGDSEGISTRLALIEQNLATERESRIQLEAEVEELKQQNAEFASLLTNSSSGNPRLTAIANAEGGLAGNEEIIEQLNEQRRVRNDQDPSQRQLSALVNGGFDEFQAEEIIRTTEEIQMQILNAQYEASQNGERLNTGDLIAEASQQLRSTLGDQDYEKYLEATNQSTSVGIRNVLESSPAQLAGLQSGDDIVSYNGERVFNVNDLNRLSSSTEISGNVVVEVLRDGVPTTVSMPVGPLGISSSGMGGGMGGN